MYLSRCSSKLTLTDGITSSNVHICFPLQDEIHNCLQIAHPISCSLFLCLHCPLCKEHQECFMHCLLGNCDRHSFLAWGVWPRDDPECGSGHTMEIAQNVVIRPAVPPLDEWLQCLPGSKFICAQSKIKCFSKVFAWCSTS